MSDASTCPVCALPMVFSDEIGKPWCCVYGTHEFWPWSREWTRVKARRIRKTSTMIPQQINTPNQHESTSNLSSDPQEESGTMEATGGAPWPNT